MLIPATALRDKLAFLDIPMRGTPMSLEHPEGVRANQPY